MRISDWSSDVCSSDLCSRLQQILEWTGANFEGVILFDESHSMGNAAGTKDEYRRAKGSEQGLAGVRLQNALPRARVVYESATGATKPENLSYASRLGRSEEHTSELQSLMRISYAVFCLKKKKNK